MSTGSIAPLHVEPAAPALLSQEAVPQGAADLAEAALWGYRLRYGHEHAAQDEVFITVSLNTPLAADESPIAADGLPPSAEYRICVRLDYSEDGERIEALRLTRAGDEAGCASPWPSVEYLTSGGPAIELGGGKGEGSARAYVFDPPVPSGEWPIIGLTWGGLNVAGAQNARAALSVVRNGDLGAQGTSEDYLVYRSATVHASDVATPFNRWSQYLDIGPLGETVGAALDAAFAALFGDRRIGQRVTMELRYGFRLSSDLEPDDAPTMYLPVGLYPNQTITADTAAQIASVLSAWKDANHPATSGGEWLFSLVLFSQVDTRTPRPLLDLAGLVYRLR